MKTLNIMAILVLLISSCEAQIKNAKIETIKIYGNCGMCEKTIEKAGNAKGVAKVDWDKDSKMATITYNAGKTTMNDVLKRIALAGYDSDEFRAPDDVYNDLHGCCQYERKTKSAGKMDMGMKEETKVEDHSNHNHDHDAQSTTAHNHDAEMAKPSLSDTMSSQGMTELFANYFALKNAFVASDKVAVFNKAGALYRTIKSIDMNSLDAKVHVVWMKKMKELESDASAIANSKDLEKQRAKFIRLSNNIYSLAKVAKQPMPVYYQHCPMANGGKGANWLSLESKIQNPYYGSQMMNCGKTVETIK